jgi:hypothetical protein
MAAAHHEQEPPSGHLEPGTRVEVRTGFDLTWAHGFVVEEAADVGYRLRRASDDSVLPARFPSEDVRRDRRNSMWWV